jgi:hypothetical protein
MAPEEAEAVLETIWDLHDKVSDAIHALSRAHFLRAVRRRASGVVYVKGGGFAAGDEPTSLAALAEEASSLHSIRAALEDLEDRFECFLVSLLLALPPLLVLGRCYCSCVMLVWLGSVLDDNSEILCVGILS